MSRESEPPNETNTANPGAREMVRLLQAEIARLSEELEAVRMGDHPQRRTLIKDRVARLDERQDALERLESLVSETDREN